MVLIILTYYYISFIGSRQALNLRLGQVTRGSSYIQGRVEVQDPRNGKWGTVCDDYFYSNDAQVVCKQLGYTGASAVRHQYSSSGSRDTIYLDNVQCGGNEYNIGLCRKNPFKSHDCSHREDVGVKCSEYQQIKLFRFNFNIGASAVLCGRHCYLT